MTVYVVDIEGDSLTPNKIWCVGCQDETKSTVRVATEYEDMRKLFSREDATFVCHNAMRFDKPVLERILGIKIKARIIDTLFLSWYLEPRRDKHGLDSFGEEAGIPKPKIDDWENLSIEEYKHRVTEDVKINAYVWKKQQRMLKRLYGSQEEVDRFIDFLMLHAEVAADQEKFKWKLDIARCKRVLEKLDKDWAEKTTELEKHMPQVPTFSKRKYPAKPYKINGELSESGKKWFNLLEDEGLPKETKGPITVQTGWKEPNAGSVPQVKDWLYSLGWRPSEFKFERNKETGEVRKIPQIRVKTDEGPDIAPCVKLLLDKEPSLTLLAELGVITHRKGILSGFLRTVDENGYVQAQIQGLTNTLRWKHKIVLNLPGVDKLYGEDIRGALIAEDGYELCGSDMCSLNRGLPVAMQVEKEIELLGI